MAANGQGWKKMAEEGWELLETTGNGEGWRETPCDAREWHNLKRYL